ncbi:flagellar hook-associated protein FlgK [Paenibacillus sp. FSL W8-0186]|uniref:Flagellar hook-associated protein 1 n=1 Tax=Paenibacillus woosongensis TaxID=307580 RepID=A0ABQ4MW91_9BACL|nr:flagellar hook-associated protein FlgK [Paenibacillus woosongensis]GIP60204.1 flagellar hook-associated protein 1 [Paenibacillus woosongensis]
MRSTFHTLEVGKRGVVAQQTALATTGHNITNANAPGYSRQVAKMAAARPIEFPGMTRSTNPNQLGMGVEVTSIKRIRDFLLDIEYRNQNSDLSTWIVKQETLSNVEGIFNEPSENSIATSISEFWNAWQLLSKNPSSTDLSARTVVQQKAIALTETFNHIASQLNTLQNNLTQRIDVKVAEVNNTVQQISDLTIMINRVEGLGDNANDLRDQRDLLIDQLSTLGNLQVIETDDNYQVIFGDVMVVDGIQPPTEFALANVNALTRGEIAGYVESRDVHVQNYITQMNVMANTLATGKIEVTLPAGSILPPGVTIPGAVMDPTNPRKLAQDTKHTVDGLNGLHKLGYTLQEPATAGKDFFVATGGGTITAANIRVNPEIVDNLANIAAAMRTEQVTQNGVTTEKVLQGNGDLALMIASLAEGKFDYRGQNGAITNEGTFAGYLQSVIAQLGTDSDDAYRMVQNGTLLSDHADRLRQAVSSVSLDEEMADMIRFQHAYSASARVMTTIDEMLDKLINGTGVVGR